MKYALIPIYLVLTVLGLIFMKLGENPGQISIKEGKNYSQTVKKLFWSRNHLSMLKILKNSNNTNTTSWN